MKTLPIGISAGTGRNKGYRLNRTVGSKNYNFGSFQNIEHALRTNGYIDIIVEDLKQAHAKEGVISIDEIQILIVENSLSDMQEITRLLDGVKNNFDYQSVLLGSEIARLRERLDEGMHINEPDGKKSFWNRILGR